MSAPAVQVRTSSPERLAQLNALHEITDVMRDRKAYRVDMLAEADQLYCASLFLGTHRDWMDDLTPADVPELYAVIPQMLMVDSTSKARDDFDRYQNLWTMMRRACLKQAQAGIAHELKRLGVEL